MQGTTFPTMSKFDVTGITKNTKAPTEIETSPILQEEADSLVINMMEVNKRAMMTIHAVADLLQ